MNINERRSRAWTCVPCLAALTLFSAAAAEGQVIYGSVTDVYGIPLRSVLVTFFDSTNAERISAATTAFDGSYKSELIPPGNYRVRFTASSYYPAFFGTAFDDYCLGTAVAVVPDGTTSGVDQVMKPSEPAEVLLTSGEIRGLVTDATTGLPLAGITVSIFSVNGEVFLQASTEATGEYRIGFQDLPRWAARVRFSDPAHAHFPLFFGTAGLDDFCLGTVVDLTSGKTVVADAFMQPIPGQLAENLVDQIEDLSLPENVVTVLAAPLVQAANLLTDDNPGNDQGVCGQLTAFITRVDIQEKRGQLAPAEAAELRRSAESLKAALACN